MMVSLFVSCCCLLFFLLLFAVCCLLFFLFSNVRYGLVAYRDEVFFVTHLSFKQRRGLMPTEAFLKGGGFKNTLYNVHSYLGK